MSDYKLTAMRRPAVPKNKPRKCLVCSKEEVDKNLIIRPIDMGTYRAIGIAHREGSCS